MKYLIAGLGNIGFDYANTRHNIGFQTVDAFARKEGFDFRPGRHAFVGETKLRGRQLIVIKPTTYMNLSGKAVNYWLQQAKIPVENLLVVVDDIALPFGSIRLRAKGSDAGHNGLAHINQMLGHNRYARLRFGIGNEFFPGRQADYVLGNWSEEEEKILPERIETMIDAIKSFVNIGISRTMNNFNNK